MMPGVGTGQQSEPVYKGLFNTNCLDAAVQGLRERETERGRDGGATGPAGDLDLGKIHTPPLYLHYLVFWRGDMKGRTWNF